MNSRGKVMHRMVGLLLAVLMVVSMFAAVPFTAGAEEGASANETVYLDFNAINSSVRRYGINFDGFNYPSISAYTDYCTVEFSSRAIHEAGTYTVAETGGEYLYRRYHPSTTTVNFTDGSFTITLDEGFVTLSGTFTGDDGKTYVVTVTDSDRPIETIEINLDANNSSFVWNDSSISDLYWIQVSFDDDYYLELELLNNHVEPQTPGTYTYTSANEELGYSYIGEFQSDDLPVYFVAGSYTVTVDENLVTTVCGTLTGDDGKAYVLTLTNGSGGSNIPEEEYTLTLANIGAVPEPSFWRSYFPERYSGDGNAMYNISVQMPYGLCITLPTANEMTLNGYSFQGWYTQSQISSGDFSTSATTFDFTRDETLIARWNPNTYTVTVDPNGGYRNLYYSPREAHRDYNPYTVSTVYGYWLRLFGNEEPIRRDGYRLIGFTGVNGGSVAGSFIEPSADSNLFNDLDEYYYRIGPTDETLVAQWEKIPEDQIGGTTGENLTWSIENGVLTISGAGAMEDYDVDGFSYTSTAPWAEQDYNAVIISEGVTYVGAYAFFGDELTSIVIADSVTSIGEYAFATYYGASDSVELTLSQNLAQVGECVFINQPVAEVTIPGSLTAIGDGMFAGNNALTRVTIEDGVETIGVSAFDTCPNLTDVDIPNSVTRIENGAFAYCGSLTSLHIPGTVTSMGEMPANPGAMGGADGVFAECTALEYVCSDTAGGAVQNYCEANDIEFRVCDGHRPVPQDQISVTIGDQIGVNLLLDLDARDAQNVTVVYKDLDGVEQREPFTDFSALPRTDEGLYKIAVQIAPAQIADTVTVYIDGEQIDACVKDYCNTLTAGGYTPEVAALAQAVLDYGQAANNFFDYTDETMSALNGLAADDAKAWQPQFADTTGKIQDVSFMALTKPEFRFYMQDVAEAEAAAFNAAGIRAAYADTTVTAKLDARFVQNEQGRILIEVTGVMAEYMDEKIVVTVPGLGTITFAGNDFAKMMANNAATETLGAALYAYGAAAKACFVNA